MVMSTLSRLEEDYRELLARYGLSEYNSSRIEKLKAGHERVLEQEKGSDPDFDAAEMANILRELEQEARTGVSLFRQLVLDFSKELEPAIARHWPDFSQPLLIREFPTGEFNATARLVPNGVLILLNEGLFMFIHQVLMLLGYAFSLDDRDDARLPDDEIGERLTYSALYYLDTGDARSAKRVLPLGGPKGALIAEIRRECEKFVLAHEYGHAVAGHLHRDNNRSINSHAGELSVIEKNWDDEFEADSNGLRLMLSDVGGLNDERVKRRTLRAKISGIFFFFALDHFLDKVKSAKRGSAITLSGSHTHPPALDRLNRLFDTLCESYDSHFVYSSGFLNALLEPHGEEIASAIRNYATKKASGDTT